MVKRQAHMAKEAACQLVLSDIHHTRHRPRPHFLARPGLSILIDLDRLEDARKQSAFFSLGRFNLLSFREKEYGCFHKAATQSPSMTPAKLSDYVRELAASYGIKKPLEKITLLTFPRILGVSFNPISVYQGYDDAGALQIVIYEVHNTFGDIHSYVGLCGDAQPGAIHEARKMMHVSPFFTLEGGYQLLVRQRQDKYSLIIRYRVEEKVALTATLRGAITPLTTASLIKAMISQRQWPMRPWFAIHAEAFKLLYKRMRFFTRPEPAAEQHSLTAMRGTK